MIQNVVTARMMSSARQDWKTPRWFYDRLNAAFDLQMDPCTDHENHLGCKYFLTPNADGLKYSWFFNCFVNPPFRQTRSWVQHAYNQSLLQSTTNVCLTASRTGTRAWQDVIFPHARAICFMGKRLHFDEHKDPIMHDTAISVFTSRQLTREQKRCLEEFGYVYHYI